MTEDRQVRKLRELLSGGMPLYQAAMKTGMDEKTARKYRDSGRQPSELAAEHAWRTREDPFEEVWPEVHDQLAVNPGLQAKTLFAWLQRKHPGRFQDGQLRTFQRGVKAWRATEGPAKEVFFRQVHHPGRLDNIRRVHAASQSPVQPKLNHPLQPFTMCQEQLGHGLNIAVPGPGEQLRLPVRFGLGIVAVHAPLLPPTSRRWPTQNQKKTSPGARQPPLRR